MTMTQRIVVAALLVLGLAACSEETKQSAQDTLDAAGETMGNVKDDAMGAAESARDSASDAMEIFGTAADPLRGLMQFVVHRDR